MKKGDRIICVNNKFELPYGFFTLYQEYKVSKVVSIPFPNSSSDEDKDLSTWLGIYNNTLERVIVRDNTGFYCSLEPSRFITLNEYRKQKIDKLNNI